MSENKPNYDQLVCGNCGYDGGKSHLKEKLQWQLELSKASQINDATRQSRHIGFTVSAVLCTLITAIAYVVTQPDDPVVPENPTIVKMKMLEEMYSTCMNQVYQMDKNEKPANITKCNETFSKELKAMKIDSETKEEVKNESP